MPSVPTSYTWVLVAAPTPVPVPSGTGTPVPPTATEPDLYGFLIQLFPFSWLPPEIREIPPTGQLAALFYSMANNLGLIGDEVMVLPDEEQSALKDELRLKTMSGSTLDIAAADYWGTQLQRLANEADPHYLNRIISGLFVPAVTRPAIFAMLQRLTGIAPHMIDPWKPSDVGGHSATTGHYTLGSPSTYQLATNCPPSYLGIDVAGAPHRLSNPGGRYGVNPGFAWQAFIITTWPQGFGAQGNEVGGRMTITGSNPPVATGGTYTLGSPSVFTNVSGACKAKCSSIAVVNGKSVFTVVIGDPTAAKFNPRGLMPNDLENGMDQVLGAIDRMRAFGRTLWVQLEAAEDLAAEGWTS